MPHPYPDHYDLAQQRGVAVHLVEGPDHALTTLCGQQATELGLEVIARQRSAAGFISERPVGPGPSMQCLRCRVEAEQRLSINEGRVLPEDQGMLETAAQLFLQAAERGFEGRADLLRCAARMERLAEAAAAQARPAEAAAPPATFGMAAAPVAGTPVHATVPPAWTHTACGLRWDRRTWVTARGMLRRTEVGTGKPADLCPACIDAILSGRV